MDRRSLGFLAALLIGSIWVLVACDSSGYTTKFGTYRAPTASGQDATVIFDAQGRTATLRWVSDGQSDSIPVTVSWSGGRIILDLGLGLQIDGRLTGTNQFQLTYPQYSDGEPELGEPVRTLTFSLAPIG